MRRACALVVVAHVLYHLPLTHYLSSRASERRRESESESASEIQLPLPLCATHCSGQQHNMGLQTALATGSPSDDVPHEARPARDDGARRRSERPRPTAQLEPLFAAEEPASPSLPHAVVRL